MKQIKKVLSLMLVIISIVAFATIPASAATGSASKSMKSSSSTTKFSNSLSWINGGISGCKYVGTSGTYWYGSTPYNADNITHKDVITVSKIGSVSVSNSGGSVSISGGTITNKYSVNNTWQVNVNYDYKVSGYLLTARFNTAAQVQFGSTFYSWSN